MAKVLRVYYGEEDNPALVYDKPVGKFTFAEDEFGGFNCTGVAPYDPSAPAPAVAARTAAPTGGGALGRVLSPGLAALSEGLKEKSRASAERARAAAQEQEAAKQAATPSRLPEDQVPPAEPESDQ